MDPSKPDDKPRKWTTSRKPCRIHNQTTERKTDSPMSWTNDIRIPAAEEPPKRKYMTGWRLYILIFVLCLRFLLSTFETTIVLTSLISITNALSGFEKRDWDVTSYMLTYTGSPVITLVFSAAVLLTCRLMVERRPRLGGIDERGLAVVDGNIEVRGINQTEG